MYLGCNKRILNIIHFKIKKKFSVFENFLYQRERIVSRNLMLKANQAMI